MKNLKWEIVDNELIIKIDLSKDAGKKTRKGGVYRAMTTGYNGNELEGTNLKLSLALWEYAPKREQPSEVYTLDINDINKRMNNLEGMFKQILEKLEG